MPITKPVDDAVISSMSKARNRSGRSVSWLSSPLWALGTGLLLAASSAVPGAVVSDNQQLHPTALELLELYDRGEFDEALLTVRQLVDPAIISRSTGPMGRFRQLGREIGDVVPAWVAAAAPNRRPLRARSASTLMLEAANLGLNFNVRLESCLVWLNTALGLRKSYPSNEQDRRWYLAALAVIEGTAEPQLIEQFIEKVKTTELEQPYRLLASAVAKELRFPDRRLTLEADAVTGSGGSDHTLMSRTAPTRTPRPLPSLKPTDESGYLRAAQEAFDRARALEPVRGEATLRSGRVLARLRENDRALALLSSVPELTRDSALLYLSHLFRGEIFERLQRTSEARDAYRAAAGAAPRARTVRLMLAPLLFQSGAQQEAAELANMATSLPLADDPWVGYTRASRRHWDARIAVVRSDLR